MFWRTTMTPTMESAMTAPTANAIALRFFLGGLACADGLGPASVCGLGGRGETGVPEPSLAADEKTGGMKSGGPAGSADAAGAVSEGTGFDAGAGTLAIGSACSVGTSAAVGACSGNASGTAGAKSGTTGAASGIAGAASAIGAGTGTSAALATVSTAGAVGSSI